MKIKRILFLIAGLFFLAVGCVGIALPVLPTVPFFLLTLFCFSQSSERLHDWFIETGLYKKNLETFVKRHGMTFASKLKIIISVTAVMGIGFFFMKSVPVARWILAGIWVCHMMYFIFRVKTLPPAVVQKRHDEASEAENTVSK